MTSLGSIPLSDSSDPIDSDDIEALRMEILRLRDARAARGAEREILEGLLSKQSYQLADLAASIQRLGAELSRNPIIRIGRALLRQFGRRPPLT